MTHCSIYYYGRSILLFGKLYKRLECRVISATMRPHEIAHVWDLLDILCMKISRQCGVLFGHASDGDLHFIDYIINICETI